MSPRHKLVALALGLCCVTAQAGVDWREMVQACKASTEDAQLAACIRQGITEQEAAEQVLKDKENIAAQQEAQALKYVLRESSSAISSIVGPRIADAGSSVSYLRDSLKDTDATVAKVAVFAVWPTPRGFLLQPFAGAAWQRDATKTPKKDFRELTAGMLGPIWQTPDGPGNEATTLFTTFQLTHRNDRYGSTSGDQLRAHLDWSYGPLSSGKLLGGLAILPQVAALARHRSGGGPEDGYWGSLYAGVAMSKPLDLGAHHLKISWLARKLFDVDVPGSNTRRRDKYSNLTLEYFVTDPNDKASKWQTSFFVSRETGVDFLEYGDKVAKTTAGIKAKFN